MAIVNQFQLVVSGECQVLGNYVSMDEIALVDVLHHVNELLQSFLDQT
jgi:hypothetical protein